MVTTADSYPIITTNLSARNVAPYYKKISTHAKLRWWDKSLLEMYQEFRRPIDYFQRLIDAGDIRVNDQAVTPEYIIKNRDVITQTVHVHEPPVHPYRLIYQDADVVVVDKQNCIVHPSSQIKYNSLLEMIRWDLGLWGEDELHCVHRLDRLTSGIVIFARSGEYATFLCDLFSSRSVQKTYLCRVRGGLPGFACQSHALLDII